MKIVALVCLLTASLASTARADNLVVNGSFENGLTGWLNAGEALPYKDYGATDGSWSLIFAHGNNAGSVLSQEIDTISGTKYSVAFDWKSTHPAASSEQSLSFFAEGSAKVKLTELSAFGSYGGPFNANSPFLHFSTTFVANSSKTNIVFSDSSASSYQADQVLDRITVSRVAAVPEPETYAMLLAGLGLMGMVARRRQAQQG